MACVAPPDDLRDDVAVARLRPVLFDLWLPRGPELSWQVVSLRGTEALSQPYQFELELWCDDPETNFEQVLGADCELLLDRNGLERTIYGVIAEIEILLASELRIERDGIGARVKVVPAFRLLDQELDTQFFTGQTAIQMLATLLAARLAAYERTLDVESRIKGEYNPRDYCVQFRESTFDFCSRIMEEEGIAYVFVPDDENQRERMVLVDNNQDYGPVELLIPDEPMIVELDRPEELDRESIQAFHWRHRPAANRILTRGYNYKLGNPLDEGEAEDLREARAIVRERVVESAQRQIIDDPLADPNATSFDGSALAQQVPLARRLLEAQRVDTAIGRGQGNAVGFAVGSVFELERPPIGGPRTSRFLLTRVTHIGRVSEGSDSTDYAYENQFECMATSQIYRPPRRTAKPRVHGVQTGIVVGNVPDEIHTDSLGRVQVAFHMQRHNSGDEHASCWIRVAQIWAGPGYGAMVIPRVGMEVVVAFVDGDPDRPLITGCVYNGTNAPPYELPSELSKSTFKTSSTPGSQSFSEVRFEDAEGSEQLFVRAQRRMDLRVQGTLFETCTGNREERIGSIDAEGNSSGEYNQTIVGNINFQANSERIVWGAGDTHLTCNKRWLEANLGDRLLWSDTLYQLSAPTVVTEASDTISHKANFVTLAGSEAVSLMGGAKLVFESNNAIELRVGNSFILLGPDGIDIQGYTLRLNSGGGVGHAKEALSAKRFESKVSYEALPADDGRIHVGGSGGGGGKPRQNRTWKLEPHEAPPMKPPPSPPKPGDPIVPYDIGEGSWRNLAWKQTEVWCSEEATLLLEAEDPGPSERATVLVQNAADGEVVLGVGVFARDGSFEQPITLCDILPRTLASGIEDSRELNAYLSVGLPGSNSTQLRFLSNLARIEHDHGHAHFDLEVCDHVVEIHSTIPYKRGFMAYVISLGDLAPDYAKGLIGAKIDGTTDWRYCKKSTTGSDPDRLFYWDGQGWAAVPSAFHDTNTYGTKLFGIAVWREDNVFHTDGVIKTQYGREPWPDDLPEWSSDSLTHLNETVKPKWIEAISNYWSGQFDLKRDQCHGHDPQCCRYRVTCTIGFVEVDTKLKGGIVIGENHARANSGAWPRSASDRTAIHEFGHHLGNPDEYFGASTVNIWVNGDGAILGIDKRSIMGGGRTARRRHLNTVAAVLAKLVEQETGKSYTYTAVEPLSP